MWQRVRTLRLPTLIVHYAYRHLIDTRDVETAFKETYPALETLLTELLVIHGNMRVQLSITVLMEKDITLDDDGEVTIKSAMIYFKSANHDLFDSTGIETLVWLCVGEIVDKLETFVQNGSGWRVGSIDQVEVNVGELRLFQNARVRVH
ncbi:unnamed protein product [Allacma fusca]|uniref:Uncharacterized protein n=1 Tax=Allacma fusca TaxID=39272 RepID=A0A8J2K588_9HEXA|nr:unnamed protein product [Allacma fusca]